MKEILKSYASIKKEYDDELAMIVTYDTDYYVHQLLAVLATCGFAIELLLSTIFVAFVYVPFTLLERLFK